jgi:Zn-dependent M28 family amino/carboxypeptidase
MDLARHFSQPNNRPDYSIAFMAFSGEEAGLYGSKYYVSDPLFDLRAILLLVNLDMVGTGSQGITVVNGKAYKGLYDKMTELNSRKHYLPEIKARGEACNSDHCPFYNIGIKSIFIYTRGEEHTAYHNIADTYDNLPFTAYEGLFKLLTDYIQYIN